MCRSASGRALELTPGDTWAVARYAAYLAATGRVEESLPVIRRAHELDPLSYVHATYVGTHHLWARRDDEAGLWGLHVWIWRHNPLGMFADWNPNVTCEHAS